jgi:phage-related protein
MEPQICLLLLGILPLFAFPQSSLPAISSRIFGGFVRIVLIMTIGGLVWIKLGLYTWVTAMMLYASGLAIGWLESKNWKFGQNWRELGQKIAIATVDIFDRGISRNQSIEWLLLPWQATKKLITNRSIGCHSQHGDFPALRASVAGIALRSCR